MEGKLLGARDDERERRCGRLEKMLKEIGIQTAINPTEMSIELIVSCERLIARHKERVTLRDIKLEDLRRQIKLYKAQGEMVKEILRGVGVYPPEKMLSPHGKRNLLALARLASTLGVKDASLTSMMLSLGSVANLRSDAEKKMSILEENERNLLNSITKAQRIENRLESEIKEQSAKAEKLKNSVRHMHGRIDDYKKSIRTWKDETIRSGVTKTITHQSISTVANKLRILEEEKEKLEKTLQAYHQLPPNLGLARKRIEEAKIRLQQLDQDFKERCANMCE